MSSEKQYPYSLQLTEDPEFAPCLEKLKKLQDDHATATHKRNLVNDVLKKAESFNQFDREIIIFQKSLSGYGLSEGEWKMIIITGLKVTIKNLDEKIQEIEIQLRQLINT